KNLFMFTVSLQLFILLSPHILLLFFFFSFNAPAPSEIYSLSLHDALPIFANVALPYMAGNLGASNDESTWILTSYLVSNAIVLRSEEHTSELQSRGHLVCRLLLEKKKKKNQYYKKKDEI